MKMNHYCHALGCSSPCPPAHLMCATCWATVDSDKQREVYRTVKLRGPYVDHTWAPWWRARAHAIYQAATRRDETNGRAPDPRGPKWLKRELAFADKLERD